MILEFLFTNTAMGNDFCGFEIRGKNRLKRARLSHLKAKLWSFFGRGRWQAGIFGLSSLVPAHTGSQLLNEKTAKNKRVIEDDHPLEDYP